MWPNGQSMPGPSLMTSGAMRCGKFCAGGMRARGERAARGVGMDGGEIGPEIGPEIGGGYGRSGEI